MGAKKKDGGGVVVVGGLEFHFFRLRRFFLVLKQRGRKRYIYSVEIKASCSVGDCNTYFRVFFLEKLKRSQKDEFDFYLDAARARTCLDSSDVLPSFCVYRVFPMKD